MASSDTESAPPAEQAPHIDVLSKSEQRWKELYTFLLDAGYRLRSRYEPDWKPSWLESPLKAKDPEDALRPLATRITHAVHLTTGQYVVLKLVDTSMDTRELEIMDFLSTEGRDKDPRNHCIRSLEILNHPTESAMRILVLPLLRKFDDPPFETIGEVVDFVGQVLEGIEFLHDNGVAHMDISINNVMLDGSDMYPTGFHPVDQSRNPTYTGPTVRQFTRTEKPPAYFFIDFGISLLFEDDDRRVIWERMGTDFTVPEFHPDSKEPINPFEVDIYCLGNLIKKDIVEGNPDLARSGYHGFEFLEPLVEAMTRSVAKERPSISAALEQFHSLVEKVDRSHLRARCRRKPLFKGDRELLPVEAYNAMRHTYKKMVYTYKGFPPVPQRNPPKDKKPTSIEQTKRPFSSLVPRRLLPSTSKSEPTTNTAKPEPTTDTANPEPAADSENPEATTDTANPEPIANADPEPPTESTNPESTAVTTK